MQPNQQQPQGGYPQPMYPPVPAAPAIDMDKFKQEVVADLTEAVKSIVPPQQTETPQTAQEAEQKKYDNWGAVFDDVGRVIDQKFQEREQAAQQANEQNKKQGDEQNKWIDDQFTQLRGAGYLPPVANQFDNTDAGKQAENELLGYAIAMGTTNLAQAAQELKFRHDNGYRYDWNTKQFVSAKEKEADDGKPDMFGNLDQPQQPQAPQAQQQPMYPYPPQPYQPGMQPVMQQPYTYPVGPTNPYMQPPVMPMYPPGFNAPVSNGAGQMGTQGQVPSLRTLRGTSYDGLVETFMRTQ